MRPAPAWPFGRVHPSLRISKISANPLWTRVATLAISHAVFRRSSAVEQLTVNQLVVGSIPTAGAKIS